MTAFDDTGVIGHLTMRYPSSSKEETRLGFVIIDNSKRGKGYGKEMLSLAIYFAFEILRVNKISLGVFENNMHAIKCYQSCGFEKVALEKVESYECMGETWNCLELELRSSHPQY